MSGINRLPRYAVALLLSSAFCTPHADASTARVAKPTAFTFDHAPKATFIKKRSTKEIELEELINSLSEAFRKSVRESTANTLRIQNSFEAPKAHTSVSPPVFMPNTTTQTPFLLTNALQQTLDALFYELATQERPVMNTRTSQPVISAPMAAQVSLETQTLPPASVTHTAPYFIPPPPPGPPPTFVPSRRLVIQRGSNPQPQAATRMGLGALGEAIARRAQQMQANRNGSPSQIAQRANAGNPFANVQLRPGANPGQVPHTPTHQITHIARSLRQVSSSTSANQGSQSNQSILGLKPSEILQMMRAQRAASAAPSATMTPSPTSPCTATTTLSSAAAPANPSVNTAPIPAHNTPVQVVQITPGVIPPAPPLPPAVNTGTAAAVFGLADPGNTLGQLQAQGRVQHASLFTSLSQSNLQAGLRPLAQRVTSQPAPTPPTQPAAPLSAMAALGQQFLAVMPGTNANRNTQAGRQTIDMTAIRAEAAAREAENAAERAAAQAIIEQARLDRIARDEARRRARADAERIAQANAAIQQQRALEDARSGVMPGNGGVLAGILGHNRANMSSADARVRAAAPPVPRTPLTPEQIETARRDALRRHAATLITARRSAMFDSDDDDDDDW